MFDRARQKLGAAGLDNARLLRAALAGATGFQVGRRWGHRLAYVQHLHKPDAA